MNEMTFKPRKNEINKQIQFFSLEWEELICVDGVGGAAAQENKWNQINFNLFDWFCFIGGVAVIWKSLIFNEGGPAAQPTNSFFSLSSNKATTFA